MYSDSSTQFSLQIKAQNKNVFYLSNKQFCCGRSWCLRTLQLLVAEIVVAVDLTAVAVWKGAIKIVGIVDYKHKHGKKPLLLYIYNL